MSVIKQYFDYQSSYSNQRWNWLKVPFIIFWFITAVIVLSEVSVIVQPTSVCKFIDCTFFTSFPVKLTICLIALVCVILYILEKKMLFVTGILSTLSVLIFTMEDSQGIYNRNDVLSGILIAQFVAYFVFSIVKSNELLNRQRIFFSQQMIIAIYFLAGLAKILSSGIFWFQNTERFALQVYKSNMNKYVDFKNLSYLIKAERMSAFVLSYPTIIASFLFVTLLLELGVILMLFKVKEWMIYYGTLLLLMHLGIWIFMSILITPIIVVNLIFFINIFYLLYLIVFQRFQNFRL